VGKVLNLLDIIIVNYNSTDYLLSCLGSVYDSLQGLPAKVFVQDNASEDDVDRVNEAFPKVLLSKNSYNMGFSTAANNALKQSAAPYVVLLNPDTHVPHGFFECVLRYMEENPDVGIIGPKILNRDGSVQGSARSFPTLLTAFFGRNSLLTGWFPNSRLARVSQQSSCQAKYTHQHFGWSCSHGCGLGLRSLHGGEEKGC
jgi:GT2 family glycosyltransferase